MNVIFICHLVFYKELKPSICPLRRTTSNSFIPKSEERRILIISKKSMLVLFFFFMLCSIISYSKDIYNQSNIGIPFSYNIPIGNTIPSYLSTELIEPITLEMINQLFSLLPTFLAPHMMGISLNLKKELGRLLASHYAQLCFISFYPTLFPIILGLLTLF